ncbi:MAG: hypothetical protein ACK4ME_11845, partial [Fimbriimonadales bacterium]
MRLNKILAIAGLAILTSAALAQDIRVTMTAYDAGGNVGGVLDPTNPAGIYRLYIGIEGVGDWIN